MTTKLQEAVSKLERVWEELKKEKQEGKSTQKSEKTSG